MSLAQQQELESKYVMGTFTRKPVEFVSGNGMTLTDDKGKQYLDFIGGIGVISLGHCAPALVKTLQEQTAKLMHVSNYYYIEHRGEVAEKLSNILGGTTDSGEPVEWKTFFSNSGAESNECAIKLARLYAKRFGNGGSTIVTITNSFHGRTLATLAATAQPLKQEANLCPADSSMFRKMTSQRSKRLSPITTYAPSFLRSCKAKAVCIRAPRSIWKRFAA